MSMTSNKAYLVRAFYDWIVDNDCTPYIVADAFYPGVAVPQQHVSDGQIVLNLAPRAITSLVMGNRIISFTTRFGGVPSTIELPVQSILGIYARENGQGMMFEPETGHDPQPPAGPGPVKSVPSKEKPSGGIAGDNGKKPSLRIVK